MCMKYWLSACSSLPRKNVARCTNRPAMTIAVDLGRKVTKQTNNKQTKKQTKDRRSKQSQRVSLQCVNGN